MTRPSRRQFLATPLAHLDALHEVTLVWFDDTIRPHRLRPEGWCGRDRQSALQRQPAPPLELLPMPNLPRLGRPL